MIFQLYYVTVTYPGMTSSPHLWKMIRGVKVTTKTPNISSLGASDFILLLFFPIYYFFLNAIPLTYLFPLLPPSTPPSHFFYTPNAPPVPMPFAIRLFLLSLQLSP